MPAWKPGQLTLINVDPRGEREYVDSISGKARAVGGGDLEAILHSSPMAKISRLNGA